MKRITITTTRTRFTNLTEYTLVVHIDGRLTDGIRGLSRDEAVQMRNEILDSYASAGADTVSANAIPAPFHPKAISQAE